jgi:hypothetical protein
LFLEADGSREPTAGYVWSALSAAAQVFPAATAVLTLLALSLRDAVTGARSHCRHSMG